MRFSVIINCYNTLPIIKKSVNSVLQSTNDQTELLLVNNHPPYPEVSAFLKSFRHPRVKVLDFGRNLSHILGTQYAEKHARGEYLVRMDDDAVVPMNNWIYAMSEALQRFPELAYVGLPFAKIPLNGVNRVSTPNFTIEYADSVLFTCVMFKRDVWRAHFVIPTQGIYGNDDNYTALKAKELGFKMAYLVSHPCIHLERTSESDPLYGAWKLFYAFKTTQADFPVWRRSATRITAAEEQLMRGFGYTAVQIQEIRRLLSRNLHHSNPVYRTSSQTFHEPV